MGETWGEEHAGRGLLDPSRESSEGNTQSEVLIHYFLPIYAAGSQKPSVA